MFLQTQVMTCRIESSNFFFSIGVCVKKFFLCVTTVSIYFISYAFVYLIIKILRKYVKPNLDYFNAGLTCWFLWEEYLVLREREILYKGDIYKGDLTFHNFSKKNFKALNT